MFHRVTERFFICWKAIVSQIMLIHHYSDSYLFCLMYPPTAISDDLGFSFCCTAQICSYAVKLASVLLFFSYNQHAIYQFLKSFSTVYLLITFITISAIQLLCSICCTWLSRCSRSWHFSILCSFVYWIYCICLFLLTRASATHLRQL